MRKKDIDEKINRVREEAEQKKSFKYIFRGNKGKKALLYLRDKSFAKSTTYVKGDPMGTAFNEGIRTCLNNIETLINTPDEEFERIAEEKIKTLRQYERRSNDSTRSDTITVA